MNLAEIAGAYRAWRSKRGMEPSPYPKIGSALSALFSIVWLRRSGKGSNAVIVGMQWNAGEPSLLTKPTAAKV